MGWTVNMFLFTLVKYFQTLLGYKTAFGFLKRDRKLRSICSNSQAYQIPSEDPLRMYKL